MPRLSDTDACMSQNMRFRDTRLKVVLLVAFPVVLLGLLNTRRSILLLHLDPPLSSQFFVFKLIMAPPEEIFFTVRRKGRQRVIVDTARECMRMHIYIRSTYSQRQCNIYNCSTALFTRGDLPLLVPPTPSTPVDQIDGRLGIQRNSTRGCLRFSVLAIRPVGNAATHRATACRCRTEEAGNPPSGQFLVKLSGVFLSFSVLG